MSAHEAEDAPVTVYDVLMAIYWTLQRWISQSDWVRLSARRMNERGFSGVYAQVQAVAHHATSLSSRIRLPCLHVPPQPQFIPRHPIFRYRMASISPVRISLGSCRHQ